MALTTSNCASSDLTGTRGRPVFPNAGACEPQPAEDTIDVAMYATLQSAQTRATPDTAWSHYVDRVLAGLRSAFVMPSDLPLPVFGYAFREEPIAIPGKAASHMKGPALGVAPAMSNVVVFTLDSTGAVASIRVAASSLSGPGDTAVLAAVTDAAAAHAFPAAPASIHQREPIRFDLVVSTAQPAVGDRAIVLGRVSVPTWALRRQATLADGRQPSLAPERSAVAAVSDTMSATLEFVVDEQGRPAMATVRAVAASNGKGSEFDRAFVRRVTGALSQFHFEPALIGACPVPQITTQGFSYEQKAG